MKKSILLTAIGLGALLNANAAPIDISTLANATWNPTDIYETGTDDDTWNVKDYEYANSKFEVKTGTAYAPTGYDSAFYVYLPYEDDIDSWLVSPSFQFKSGCTYEISFSYKFSSRSSYSFLDCWLTGSKGTLNLTTANSISATTANFISPSSSPTSWTPVTFEYTPTADEVKYLNFRVINDPGEYPQGRVYLGAFSIKMKGSLSQPLAPTGLTATAGADNAITATLSWTNPTQDASGSPLTGDNAIRSIIVTRDGQTVATLEGAPTSWTDTEATGLVGGQHTYTVAAVAAGMSSPDSNEASVFVGPYLYAPTTMDFSADQWTAYSTTSLSFVSNSVQVQAPYTNAASFWSYDESIQNIWLSSPSLPLDPEKTYKVRFKYLSWNDPAFLISNFNVYANADRATADTESAILATDPVYTLTDIRYAEPNWKEVEISGVRGTEVGTHILFHVNGKVCKRFSITGLEVEEYTAVPFAPSAPTDLEATAAPYQQLQADLAWTLPTTAADGTPFTDAQTVDGVKVYRDDAEIYSSTEALTTFSDTAATGLTAGSHSYQVSVSVAGTWSARSEAATVEYVGPAAAVTLPWEPTLANLGVEGFAAAWVNYPVATSAKWDSNYRGLCYVNSRTDVHDGWVIGAPLVLDSPTGRYDLTYTVTGSATDRPALSVGLVDTTMPEEFILTIADNVTFDEETTVSFEYGPTRDASDIRLAFRAHTEASTNAVMVTKIALAENENTGIEGIETDLSGAVKVYDLSGRCLGIFRASDLDTLDKGVYIVEYTRGGRTLRTKIAR